jgi:hypothetical protein
MLWTAGPVQADPIDPVLAADEHPLGVPSVVHGDRDRPLLGRSARRQDEKTDCTYRCRGK